MPKGNNDNQPPDPDSQNMNTAFPLAEETLPPIMPIDGSPVVTTPSPTTEPVVSGSSAPSNDLATPQVVGGSASPAKKFVGGKIIATILGLFLLIGGVGAGIILTSQNQDFREKAEGNGTEPSSDEESPPDCGKVAGTTTGCLCGDTECTGDKCHCVGDPCRTRVCDQTWGKDGCEAEGRSWCVNVTGGGMTCCEPGYVCGDAKGCFEAEQKPHRPQCLDAIRIFDTNWVEMDSSRLSKLKPGEVIYIAIRSQGRVIDDIVEFEAAQFIINGSCTPETVNKHKIGNVDFYYYEYVIPTGVQKFDLFAQLKYCFTGGPQAGQCIWTGYLRGDYCK